MSKQYSILFIGNSMTYFHDMPTAIFEPMAKEVGFDVRVQSITAGGRFLWENLQRDDETAREVKAALAPDKTGAYDYVILQEGMPDLYTDTERFYSAVRSLAGKTAALAQSLHCTPGWATSGEIRSWTILPVLMKMCTMPSWRPMKPCQGNWIFPWPGRSARSMT